MRSVSLAFSAVVLSVGLDLGPVHAGGVCSYLNTFVLPVSQKHHEMLSSYDAFGGAGQAKCSASRTLGGGSTRHCYWVFDYRSDAATATFENAIKAVTQCLETQEVSPIGPEVNHPDSHAVRTYDIEGGTLTVSLKDKGALQQTLVFLIATHH